MLVPHTGEEVWAAVTCGKQRPLRTNGTQDDLIVGEKAEQEQAPPHRHLQLAARAGGVGKGHHAYLGNGQDGPKDKTADKMKSCERRRGVTRESPSELGKWSSSHLPHTICCEGHPPSWFSPPSRLRSDP